MLKFSLSMHKKLLAKYTIDLLCSYWIFSCWLFGAIEYCRWITVFLARYSFFKIYNMIENIFLSIVYLIYPYIKYF